jgi:hypothetical protein
MYNYGEERRERRRKEGWGGCAVVLLVLPFFKKIIKQKYNSYFSIQCIVQNYTININVY